MAKQPLRRLSFRVHCFLFREIQMHSWRIKVKGIGALALTPYLRTLSSRTTLSNKGPAKSLWIVRTSTQFSSSVRAGKSNNLIPKHKFLRARPTMGWWALTLPIGKGLWHSQTSRTRRLGCSDYRTITVKRNRNTMEWLLVEEAPNKSGCTFQSLAFPSRTGAMCSSLVRIRAIHLKKAAHSNPWMKTYEGARSSSQMKIVGLLRRLNHWMSTRSTSKNG
mgnify:CR=1 FL=1